jgi:phosphoserine phosphatase
VKGPSENPRRGFETVEPGALVERLDRALDAMDDPSKAAIATDGDGTLWTNDVGEALFAALLETNDAHGWIGEPAHMRLMDELETYVPELTLPASPADIARTLYAHYLSGGYPEDRVCAMMTWCMAGTPVTVLAAFAAQMLATTFDLKSKLIPEAGRVLQWAHRRGVPTLLVSASPRVVVELAAKMAAESLEIPTPPVLAMTPKVDAGLIRPELVGTWTYGEGKAIALSEALAVDQRRLVAAMGDNVFDAQMLRAACVPIAIRPKPALVNIAESVPGLVRAAIVQ